MRFDRKYLVAVVLLAVLAAAFGLAGTVMPVRAHPFRRGIPVAEGEI